jgi:hypothetical protein
MIGEGRKAVDQPRKIPQPTAFAANEGRDSRGRIHLVQPSPRGLVAECDSTIRCGTGLHALQSWCPKCFPGMDAEPSEPKAQPAKRRPRLTLRPGEARDAAGMIHRADPPAKAWEAQWAKCNPRLRVGPSERGLREYCPWCFPQATVNGPGECEELPKEKAQ